MLICSGVPPLFRTIFGWDFPVMIPGPGDGEFHEGVEFSEAQIAFVLKQAEDGMAIGEV